MNLYLYDFDGTIYDGDSSVDFFLFCMKKNKKTVKYIWKIIFGYFKYFSKYITDTQYKQMVFSFLQELDDVDELVNEFWKTHDKKIKSFYLNKDHKNDIIISASPIFLLEPICKKLKVKDLLASDIDKKTGHFNKPNNRGEEKVKVFREKYPKANMLEMYSDSMHDKPLLDLAEKSFVVKKNEIYDYESYKPSFLKRCFNKIMDIYHKKEDVWNYLVVGGLTTVVSFVTYTIFLECLSCNYIISNIISWVFAVIFAYFTNRWFVFHSKKKNKIKEFISFSMSRVVTLVIETLLMILLVEILVFNELLSKLFVQIVVIIGNYVLSKLLVFKK